VRTAIYGGHLSSFGFACIEAILESNYFQVDSIVIADLNRWITFYETLQRGQQKVNKKKLVRAYRKKTQALKRLVVDSAITIRVISTSKREEEYTFLKNYDLVLSAAFPQIFSEPFIQSPQKGAINFHPSYLPRCRGANPIYWTVASQEAFGGLSCHFMTRDLDRGPIAVQEKILFDKKKITTKELHQKVLSCLPGMILNLEYFLKTAQAATPQDELQVTYFTENLPKDHRIYWNEESYDQIDAKIRAGNAFTMHKKYRLLLHPPILFKEILTFRINPELQKSQNGTLLYMDDKSILVKIENGYLQTGYLIPVSGIRWFQKMKLYPLIRKYKIYRFNLSPGSTLE
jgi:methionyl-tRNA formyltransferase